MSKVRKGSEQIDIGLLESRATLKPGETRSLRELAKFCGVHHSAIQHIEARALKKLRRVFDVLRREGEL